MSRNTDVSTVPRYVVATVNLMVNNGAGTFGLFLLSRGAPCSTSHESLRRLHLQIREQIAQRLLAVLDRQHFASDAEFTDTVQQSTDIAAAVVLPALHACRARRAEDFRRWLDRRITEALAGDPLAAPPMAVQSHAEALAPLPLPPRDRAGQLASVLRSLPSTERRVLEIRAGGAPWSQVAERMGLSVHGSRALHARALEHAREIALAMLSGPAVAADNHHAIEQAA